MNPTSFDRLKYLYLIDDIHLKDKAPHELASHICDILEQFIDPLLDINGPLFIDSNYPRSEDPLTSNRQVATKQNITNRINNGELLEAYYELIDYLLDYGDSHNNRFYRNEIELIREPYAQLKELAEQLRDNPPAA